MDAGCVAARNATGRWTAPGRCLRTLGLGQKRSQKRDSCERRFIPVRSKFNQPSIWVPPEGASLGRVASDHMRAGLATSLPRVASCAHSWPT